MPFIGLHKETQERINLLHYQNAKLVFKPDDFICPYCKSPLTIKRSHRRSKFYIRSHFAHIGECTYEYHLPESIEHLTAKTFLFNELEKMHGKEAKVFLEYPISMEWREKGRIADVAVEYPTGFVEAHEIQLSRISVSNFEARVNDYEKSSIQSFWYFGNENIRNQDLLVYAMGLCGGYGRVTHDYINAKI